MNMQEVIDLMNSSKSEDEWNADCDTVKRAYNGGYPDYWYAEVIASGLLHRTKQNWLPEV